MLSVSLPRYKFAALAILTVVTCGAGHYDVACAQPSTDEVGVVSAPHDGWPSHEEWSSQGSGYDIPLDDFQHQPINDPEGFIVSDYPPPGYRPLMTRLGLRHSYTHSRSVGLGRPLVGTSWLNRPFYIGADIGPMWMMNRVEDSVGRDVDLAGGIFIGGDWDHYWGNELAFRWATPELANHNAPDTAPTNSLFMWNYSLMYYPWGDASLRPYWRWGIGNTHVNYPLDNGAGFDQWLLTLPIGVGLKQPIYPWLVARTELTYHLSVDGSDVRTQNNLTLSCGLEWRFGARPRSYWPWHPSRHIW